MKQLEEKHAELSEQLQQAQLEASTQRSKVEESDVKLKVAEMRLGFFKGKLGGVGNQLCEAKDKAQDYLKQLSYVSWARDIGWARGFILGFETYQSWSQDLSRTIDLEIVDTVDCPPNEEVVAEIASFSHELMLDAQGIDMFGFNPFSDSNEAPSLNSAKASKS